MALTTEKIHAKITEIYEKTAEIPTQASLRKSLGGGSFGTIGEALKSWKENFNQEEELSKVVLPEHLQTRVLQFAADVWDTSIAEADTRLKTERAALETAREELEKRELELVESINILEDEAEHAREALSELKNKLEKSEAERLSTDSKLAASMIAAESTEKALREQIAASDDKFNKLIEAMPKPKK